MNYKITGGKLLISHNGEYSVEENDLYVADGHIYAIGKLPQDCTLAFEEVDANNMLIMPGLINMHTHAYMSMMRNYADDLTFDKWLFERIEPAENALPSEAAYYGAMLACIEMIKTGTTCFVDMHMFEGQSARAAKQSGMRAFIGRGLVGDDLYAKDNPRFNEAMNEKNEYECDRIKFLLSPHAIYSAGEKLLKQVADESDKQGMLRQTHLAESDFETVTAKEKWGKTPVEYLADIGFLNDKTILAHCVKVSDADMDILKEHGCNVVTNPASNAKLGNGYAPVAQMLKKGINVCLGTDSVASNNTLNMFREMNLITLLHKAVNNDCTALLSPAVIDMATRNGAKALGLTDRLGVIKEGAMADIIFMDLNAVSMFPANNPVSALCYSANGSEVHSVMIDGKFVMRERKLLTIDEDKVYAEIRDIVERYM